MATRKKGTRKAPGNLNPVQIFKGDLIDIVAVLQEVSHEIETRFLNFAGEKSATEAQTKILQGDPVMFAKYQEQATGEKVNNFTGKEYILQNEGLFFDTATFLSGQPEYWINEIDSTIPAPAKDLKINIAAPHWVTEKDIFNKLIKVVEFIDATEATGQRLNVSAVLFCEDKDRQGQPYSIEIEIKKASQPLNLQQLVYCFASPCLLRYAGLSLQYHNKLNYQAISSQDQENKATKETEFICIPSISYDYTNNICYNGGKQFNYKKLNILNAYNLEGNQ